MSERDYAFYCDRVTDYFRAVDRGEVDAALGYFTEDAVFTEMTSATVHRGREEGIRRMLSDFCGAFDRIWHGNLVLTVDPESESVGAQFSVIVAGAGGEQRYENCNRFYFTGERFSEVYVYMSGENLLR